MPIQIIDTNRKKKKKVKLGLNRTAMARAQKTTSLQVIIAHRTASAVALSVIAGMVPADLSRTNELGLGAGRTSKQGGAQAVTIRAWRHRCHR